MERFLKRLLQLETLVAGAFYTIAAAILFLDVASRELLNQPIWGGQRMAVLFANSAALIGIGVAVALNRNIRPSVLDNVFPSRFDGAVNRTGNIVSAAVMFAGAYFAVLLVLDNKHMGFTTPPLDLEIWVPQMALPYGLASAGFRHALFAVWPSLQPQESEIV